MPEYRVVGVTATGQTLVEISPAQWGRWMAALAQRRRVLHAPEIGVMHKGTIILKLAAAELATIAGEIMEIQLDNSNRGPP